MKKLLTILILGITCSLSGQDYHFSQFFANSQLLNPAMTGNFKEDYRLNFIHRNQWSAIGSKFQTSTFGGDFKFTGGKLNKDRLGVGVQAYIDDQAGILKTQGFLLSLGYNHALDDHARHHLGGGLQVGYMSKSLDNSSLTYGSQYQNNQYNADLSSGEDLSNMNLGNLSMQIGMAYSVDISKETHAFTGISAYQITGPSESVAGSDNTLGRRYMFNLGMDHVLTDKIIIEPEFMFMVQSGATDLNIGSLLKYELRPEFQTNLILGAFYRTSDAAIALIGLEHKGIEAMFSYDVTLTDLRKTGTYEGANDSNMVGAWEISIVYKGIFRNHNYASEYTVPCGIF